MVYNITGQFETGFDFSEKDIHRQSKHVIPTQENVVPKANCSCILHFGQKCLSKGEILMQTTLWAILHSQGLELFPLKNSWHRTDYSPRRPVSMAVAISTQRRKRKVQGSLDMVSWNNLDMALVPS